MKVSSKISMSNYNADTQVYSWIGNVPWSATEKEVLFINKRERKSWSNGDYEIYGKIEVKEKWGNWVGSEYTIYVRNWKYWEFFSGTISSDEKKYVNVKQKQSLDGIKWFELEFTYDKEDETEDNIFGL